MGQTGREAMSSPGRHLQAVIPAAQRRTLDPWGQVFKNWFVQRVAILSQAILSRYSIVYARRPITSTNHTRVVLCKISVIL